MLGGQVVAEISSSGGALPRGYVYLGGQLLAVQQSNSVSWIHQDPFVKSKRVTNGSKNVVSSIELDPWGGNTNRNNNAAFQPRAFTTYERDGNASDEAMFRRYNRWWSRFDQRDPYDGSYVLTNPQSFNRYAYVQNDPVNLVDPTGLDPCIDDEGRPVDCGPPVDPSEIIRIYTLAPALSPFYIPASISGGSDILVTLIPRRTLPAVLIQTPSTVAQPTPKPGKSYWARFLECLNDNRLDNVIRDIGQSTGHLDIGDFAADLTVTGTIAAVANQGLNLTSLGKYPRQGLGGPAGSPTTWQHTISGRIARAVGKPTIGRIGRLVGRGASRAAAVLLAFEAGYEVGTVMACAAIAHEYLC